MAVQCVLVGKGKDDVFTAVYGETTFDKVSKAYNEKKIIQVVYQNRIYYLDNTTSGTAFSFISTFSDQNSEIKHYVISLTSEDSWSEPSLQNSTPATHASTHAKDGTDPLTPADIGAMELLEDVLKQSGEDITSQVARTLSGDLVPFSGGTMTGLLNVLTPVGDSNATTKKYVDDALSKKIEMDSIGDLHVWRKTVVTTEAVPEVPAGYTLGTEVTGQFKIAYGTDDYSITVSGEVLINDDGTIAGLDSSNTNYRTYNLRNYVTNPTGTSYNYTKNKFYHNAYGSNYNVISDTYIYVTSDMYVDNQGYIYITSYKPILGYAITPAIPAGTTSTYPVSTNRNAYQEGSDAKPAGYTLGEVKTGQFKMSERYPTDGYYYKYSSSISVADNGTISLDNPSQISLDSYNGGQSYANNCLAKIAGKFMYLSNRDSGTNAPDSKPPFNSVPSAVVYVPSDATLTWTEGGALDGFTLSKYQPVTGYVAIPAGTTIEYLGKLGDKARVQVVSYVGTGTYGESNPCSLTFDFPPKLVIISSAPVQNSYVYIAIMVPDAGIYSVVMSTNLGYESRTPGGSGIVTKNNKTITFYSGDNTAQLNSSGIKYYAAAIG